MIATNDSLLEDCRPIDMSRKDFLLDCEESINLTDVHSDEISSDDEVLASAPNRSNQIRFNLNLI